MRTLLFILALTTLAACPSAPRPILTDAHETRSSYRFTSVDKRSDAATTIETMLGREAIVARYSDHNRVAYVVRDDAASQPLFARVPFRSLDKATLVVHVARVSDINGWGVEVNGEVHRDATLRLAFGHGDLARAFALLQQLHTAPLDTLARVSPDSFARVSVPKAVAMFERGYVIDVSTELVTGNPFDAETRVPLYGMHQRTAYTWL